MKYSTQDFKTIFPIGAVENDAIVSKWGDVTVAFRVTLPEIFTLNTRFEGGQEQGDYLDLVESWTKAIAVLPENTIVHKQDWFTEQTYAASQDAEAFLDRASERHFNERPYLHHVCYVYLTLAQGERTRTTSLRTTLARGRIVPRKVLAAAEYEKFLTAVSQFKSILESTRRITLNRLLNDDLQPSPYAPLSESGLIERYMSLSSTEDVVPLLDIDLTSEDELRIGSKYSKFFTLSNVDDLPDVLSTHSKIDALSSENSTLSVGYATPVGLMLHCNHIYNQYIFLQSRTAIRAELEKKATNLRSLSNFGRSNAVNSQLVEGFLHYSAETNLTPVRIHANIQVWTEDKARLPEIRNKVTAAIARMNLKPRENSRDAAFFFFAGLPGNAADLPREDTFTQFVPQAVCLFNMETNYYDSKTDLGVKVVDRLAGKPIIVDFSDEPMKQNWVTNRNKFILGPSGSGKSFLTNHLLRSYHSQGSHVVVVDVGDSYQGLTAMLGGTYLTYSEEVPIHFNPFFVEGRRAPDVEKREAVKMLLQTLWKSADARTSMSEYNALSEAVTGYYRFLDENQEVFPGFDSFYEFMEGHFKLYLKEQGVKDDYFDYDNFMYNLKPYYKGGEYDFLLNSRQNLDLLHERFIVFELDNIKDHPILFPIVTIIIMDTFISKMRKLKGTRKIILIEEAWKAIMTPNMAGYIKYLYKTVRKFFGEAWIVTQEVDDIIGNPIVKDSIINNADTKILLDQRKYENKFRHVKELLALTDKEKDICLSMNRDNDPTRRYKEFFVSWGGQKSRVYGLEVSREEYFAFTTEQTEKLRVLEKVGRNGGDFDLALREIVAEERGLCA